MLLGLAFIASAVNLTFVLLHRKRVAVLGSYILEPLALLFAALLTRLNHWRTRSSSTILLLFWPCYTVAVAIWTRSYVQDALPVDPFVPRLKWIVVLLGLSSLALECFSPDDSPASVEEHPTIRANIYSKWSFAWLTPLLNKGAKTFIIEDDLPSLAPNDESERLGDRLERSLQKQ